MLSGAVNSSAFSPVSRGVWLGENAISPSGRGYVLSNTLRFSVQYLLLLLTFFLFSDSEFILVFCFSLNHHRHLSLLSSPSVHPALSYSHFHLLILSPVALRDLKLLGFSLSTLSIRSLFVGHVSTCFQPQINPP